MSEVTFYDLLQSKGRVTSSDSSGWVKKSSIKTFGTLASIAITSAASAWASPATVVQPEATDLYLSQRVKCPVKPVAMDTGWPTVINAEKRLTTSEQVDEIITTFSLPVSKAAKIFRVSRPTVYSWKDGECNIDQANALRLAELFELAQFWKSLSNEPLGRLTLTPFMSDLKSLYDLLCNDELTDEMIGSIEDRMRSISDPNRIDTLVGDKYNRNNQGRKTSEISEEQLESNLESNIRALADQED